MSKNSYLMSFVLLFLGLFTVLVAGILGTKHNPVAPYILYGGLCFLVLSSILFVIKKLKEK